MSEFKTFAMKGNVMDLAIGVIIGAAFGKIVSSLVENIIMPLVGAILGGKNFDSYSVSVGGATLKYGMFIGAIIDFIIIALVLFMVIKLMNRMSKKKVETPATAEKPADIKLLEEIRDALRTR